jgi:hypothetical protein
MSPLAAAFAGWTPIHVLRRTPEFCLLWSWLGVERFRDPFFDQTITGALHRPLSLLLQRFATLEQLVEIAEAFPALEPTGFIYHVSRCGSTLVAQMLARLDHVIVLSEPRPLSSALEDQRLSEFDRRRAFRALVRLYGRTTGGESAYFIKFDSQNLLQWRAITAAYPEVPRLIIHRDPVEVLVSNLSQQATGLLPGEIASDRLGPPPRPLASPEDYSAFVLSRFYAAAIEAAAAPGSLTLDYRALPGAVASHIAPHFGLTLSAADLAAMNTATGVYSKDASRTAPFTADSASKQAESDARTRALATEWLAPHYEKLRARSATV